MDLTWHGHSTWRVDVGSTRLIIDPFFDNLYTDLTPGDVDDVDYVLVSHGHADHIADVDGFPEATVVGTPELTGYLADQHGNETVGMNIGGTIDCDDAYVTMVHATHTNGIETDYEFSAGIPAGFVVSDTVPTQVADVESNTFYHTGDTALITEMRDVVGPYLEPDAVAVPIGDHYTMGAWQAAVAVDWIDPDYAFPMHYDTFEPIEASVERFEREVNATGGGATVVNLDGDETFSLSERP